MSGSLVEYSRTEAIGTILLNDSDSGNRFNRDMLLAFDRALIAAEEDIDAKVLLIEAAGLDCSWS